MSISRRKSFVTISLYDRYDYGGSDFFIIFTMSGHTHAIWGANMAWLAIFAGSLNESAILLVVLGALGGLLPDIDASESTIHKLSYGLTAPIGMLLRHRGILHSLIAVIGVGVISSLIVGAYLPLAPLVITSAYASHLILDAMTKMGVPLLYPFSAPFRIFPKSLSAKVGGFFDHGLFIVGGLSLISFLLVQYYPSAWLKVSPSQVKGIRIQAPSKPTRGYYEL